MGNFCGCCKGSTNQVEELEMQVLSTHRRPKRNMLVRTNAVRERPGRNLPLHQLQDNLSKSLSVQPESRPEPSSSVNGCVGGKPSGRKVQSLDLLPKPPLKK